MSGELVVLVTGASSGIGLAAAVRAAGDGHHVVLVARGATALESATELCRTAGAPSATGVIADVRDAAALGAAVDDTIARHGRLDAAVHCAGVVAYGRFEDVPKEVFDAVIETNLLGSANLARSVLPHFRDRDAGRLVIVGSVIGSIAAPMMTAYAVSKWGIRSLARQLKVENTDRPGVHITCVAPGGVDTPIYRQGANFLGYVGRPPPPVASPEKVGRVIVDLLTATRPRSRVNIGFTNPLLVFAFNAMSPVYDRLAGPMFGLIATDQRERVEPTNGNVLRPVPEGNDLHGHQGNAVVAIAKVLAARARGR